MVRLVLRLLMAVVVLVPLALPSALAQSSTTEYLDASGVPESGLSGSAPTGLLADLDPSRNSDPGLTLAKTNKGSTETDPKKYQLWKASSSNGVSLDGPVWLTITAAMKEF